MNAPASNQPVRLTLACLLVACAGGLMGCTTRPTVTVLSGDAMGTFYEVKYWSDHDVGERQLHSEIYNVLDAFENELSNWRTNSWVSRFNAAAAGERIPVPEDAFLVINLCLELAERSGGKLDPTIAPLIGLWGFGTQQHEEVPSEVQIELALETTGYRKVILDPERRTVMKTREGLQINCSAVAKGYAVDLVADCLRSHGIENHVVNIGGEIAARGTNPEGVAWRVGITHPQALGGPAQLDRTILLTNRCLATSGHSQRTFMREGRRYTHILDGRTGEPVSTGIASATAIAPTCALADGLATLALILDEAEMSALLDRHYSEAEVFRTPWGHRQAGMETNAN